MCVCICVYVCVCVYVYVYNVCVRMCVYLFCSRLRITKCILYIWANTCILFYRASSCAKYTPPHGCDHAHAFIPVQLSEYQPIALPQDIIENCLYILWRHLSFYLEQCKPVDMEPDLVLPGLTSRPAMRRLQGVNGMSWAC